MPKTYMVGGTAYNFPDEYTDEQVTGILQQQGIIPGAPKTIAGFVQNAKGSAGNFLSGIGNAIAHPLDTAANVAGLGVGMGELALAKAGVDPASMSPEAQNHMNLARGVIDFYKNRYGGVQNVLDTAYQDPVGVASDLSAVLGGGGAALKAGGFAKAAKAANTASKALNPLTLPLTAAAKASRAVAVPLMESALGTTAKDRAYGMTPGAAALDETSGFTSKAIEQSATAKKGLLSRLYEGMLTDAGSNGATINLSPARQVVNDAAEKAGAAGSQVSPSKYTPMQQFLTETTPNFSGRTEYPAGAQSGLAYQRNPFTGQVTAQGTPPTAPLVKAAEQAPITGLKMKRQLSEDFLRWNPNLDETVQDVGRQAYHAIDQQLDTAVPQGAALNQRIGSLIRVADSAERKARGAGVVQNTAARAAAQTGGLAAFWAALASGNPLMAGAALVGPEIISQPFVRIGAARGINAASKAAQSANQASAQTALIQALQNAFPRR